MYVCFYGWKRDGKSFVNLFSCSIALKKVLDSQVLDRTGDKSRCLCYRFQNKVTQSFTLLKLHCSQLVIIVFIKLHSLRNKPHSHLVFCRKFSVILIRVFLKQKRKKANLNNQ